ncbi:tetratricopeptide repeat protein [Aquimarina gracilis]|uniref:Tetratricopeptide repeat protein n=1 Tax=Aquimarina gracilis TaxID=874422 RepID=A0ABU5ZT98_9FLAO|nr:tetratricopeptide repeat protein [Aquimarina gracilis]MEB3345188.1 tetratricopeptide repeat protein [Aquimarina gracilis]
MVNKNIKGNNWVVRLLLLLAFGVVVKAEAQSSALTVADSLYTLGDYSTAIKNYEKISPKDQYTILQIARAHKAKGTYNKALNYYEKAITEYPALASTKLEYAKLLTITRKLIKADSVYSTLVSEQPKNPNFQYRLGLTKKRIKDSTAITYFKQAFALDSTHQKSCFEIATYYLKKRNYDLVWEFANLGLHSYPENAELIGILGQNFLLKEDYYSALPYFEKLLALNHENEFIHSKLGLCYTKTNEFKKGAKHLEEALKYDDKIPSRYSMLAYAYQRMEKYEKALENYKKALALKDLSLEEELMSMAMVYRFQEKWEKAIQYVKLAIKENPDSDIAHYQLAMFTDAYAKDPKIKLKYYRDYLKKFGKNKNIAYFKKIIEKRIIQLEKEVNTYSEKAVD